MSINVPTRIKQIWRNCHGSSGQFHITKALSTAKVSSKEFRKCWKMVQPMISDEELFCLFDKAFGPHDNLDDKMDFVKDILRRYKAMGEPVCACARACLAWLYFVSVCCVGLAIAFCCNAHVLCVGRSCIHYRTH